MSQRIHCIRAAVNKGYGRIHPELSFAPPYAFMPTHKYKQRGVMRISEHAYKGGRKMSMKGKTPRRTRILVRIKS